MHSMPQRFVRKPGTGPSPASPNTCMTNNAVWNAVRPCGVRRMRSVSVRSTPTTANNDNLAAFMVRPGPRMNSLIAMPASRLSPVLLVPTVVIE